MFIITPIQKKRKLFIQKLSAKQSHPGITISATGVSLRFTICFPVLYVSYQKINEYAKTSDVLL